VNPGHLANVETGERLPRDAQLAEIADAVLEAGGALSRLWEAADAERGRAREDARREREAVLELAAGVLAPASSGEAVFVPYATPAGAVGYSRVTRREFLDGGVAWTAHPDSGGQPSPEGSAGQADLPSGGRPVDASIGLPRQLPEDENPDRAVKPPGLPGTADDAPSVPTGVVQALRIVTSDDADSLGAAADSLNDLVVHYSETLPVSPPMGVYGNLSDVRSYAGGLLGRPMPARRRSDILVAAGWLSNLLAVAASYMGDQGAALVWCGDAERRGRESGHPELAGWASLTRAKVAYYQGRAERSIELAGRGQTIASIGTAAHAKLAAHEMRARAMLGDADGMTRAKSHAVHAMARLSSDAATGGVFRLGPAEDPPYTATSSLLLNRFQEAVSAANGVIEAARPPRHSGSGGQSSNHARALLILGLAEAGLGRVDEAVAAGRAALECAGPVWPTLILAAKLARVLRRDFKAAGETAEYHALYLDAVNRQPSGVSADPVALPDLKGN
jgi:hypothetical protein